jgi:hypothetical protein
MARALRAAERRVEHVHIVCGHDAADRFLNRSYDHEPSALDQLRDRSLLAAPLGAPSWIAPASLHGSAHTVEPAPVPGRQLNRDPLAYRRGEAWSHAVPGEISVQVGVIYS